MSHDDRPVLLVTGHAPPDREAPFAELHRRQGLLVALFGGRDRHGTDTQQGPRPPRGSHPFPVMNVSQRGVGRLAASGHFRAVIAGTGGRVALPAAYVGARRAGVPFLLWSSLWAHPRSAAHALSWPLLRHLYASADAVITYGLHVSDYVRARGARRVHEAPQAVDGTFWGAPGGVPPEAPAAGAWGPTGVRFLFVGRDHREKGVEVLRSAWSLSHLGAGSAALVLVGINESAHPLAAAGLHAAGPQPAAEVRNFYRSADVLLMPSISTPTFHEPWGLVANEAMHARLPIIASDAVGAARGGLVRDGRNGLIVPAGDAAALAGAMRSLAGDGEARRRLGAAGARDVAAFTPEAWAAGVSAALAEVDLSREHW